MIRTLGLALALLARSVWADEGNAQSSQRAAQATADIREFLRAKVAERAAADPCLVDSREAWERLRPKLREQLFDMLGLSPLPPRGDLHAQVVGQVDKPDLVVERIVFQSLPGLYVTANFYRPVKVETPLPAVLYLNGHARVERNGVSLGNKSSYQLHPTWFARNGYCCLTIDTLQLGEIEGLHHGTYREGMWWWISRGYTPAGVEAWHAIRALDYLETRREVDMRKIGVTGRSGGGAYTWWVAALDDRPACIAPVAGITDLEDHVVNRCIEGHCDCMFMVNRHGWDFATVACLAAPRPCLLANSDKDTIFPLSGVNRVYQRLQRVYKLLGAEDKLGLTITEGPHTDTQELQVPVFRWMNRWLKGTKDTIDVSGDKPFDPTELKVLASKPTDERNTSIHETFVPSAPKPPVPASLSEWNAQREKLLADLLRRCLAAWPAAPPRLDVRLIEESEPTAGSIRRRYEFTTEQSLRLPLTVVTHRDTKAPERVVLHVLNEQGAGLADPSDGAVPPVGEVWAFFAPRGSGENRWEGNEKIQTALRRSFVLVGTTLDEGRIWDVRRAIAALGEIDDRNAKSTLSLTGKDDGAGIALYAAIFEPAVREVRVANLPPSHRQVPILIGVLRVLDMPQAVALAFPRRVTIAGADPHTWDWPTAVARLYDAAAPPLEIK